MSIQPSEAKVHDYVTFKTEGGDTFRGHLMWKNADGSLYVREGKMGYHVPLDRVVKVEPFMTQASDGAAG